MNFSWRRVWAVVLRHEYNFRHNLDRVVDTLYWPALDVIIWGLTIYAMRQRGEVTPFFLTMILTAVILWYTIWKAQMEITVNVLEELWSDNLGNLLSTPLRLSEWAVALCFIGIIRFFLTLALTAAVAYVFYSVSVFTTGPVFVFFVGSLMLMGWAFGLFVASLFLRFGTSIQTLAWSGGFALMPFSGPYFPVASLPIWMQIVAKFIPSSYIFESMREVLTTGIISSEKIVISYGLSLIYLILAGWFFFRSYLAARERGISNIK